MNTLGFDTVIFVSSEDDKKIVSGGIGTYIGVLTRAIKRFYPEVNVYWVAKSPTKKDIEELDEFGVHRYYLAPDLSLQKYPFFRAIKHADLGISKSINFQSRIEEKILDILKASLGRTLIESGEWEGHCAKLFKTLNRKDVLKVTRLHTPLATCVRQNDLEMTPENVHQLLQEYEVIRGADIISACTAHVKRMVARDVLGVHDIQLRSIIVIPNPIDEYEYYPERYTTAQGRRFINWKLKESFFTDETLNIVILGSVESRKGVEFAFRAMPKLFTQVPRARVCFVGHHGEEGSRLTANTKLKPSELLQMIPRKYRDKVRFTGYVRHTDVPRIIASGDIFPILSLNDNFPGSVAEISLSGKAIVAFKRGGVEEMLTNSRGKFSAYDLGTSIYRLPGRFAQSIADFDADPDMSVRVGTQCRKLILTKYGTQTVLKKMFAKYSQSLEKKQIS
ncbi:TPA: hypothetical protein DEB00_00450 [Candidatus Uhrbacteria bacterium]|nr:hypothetical protein [Candidatus Uhrbacteria bacterium]